MSTPPPTRYATQLPHQPDALWPQARHEPHYELLCWSAAAGLVAATVLLFRRFDSIAGALTLIAAIAVPLVYARRTRWLMAVSAVCIVLSGLIMLRDADWFAGLSVVTVIALTLTAIADARSFPAMLSAAAAWPGAAIYGLPLLGNSLRALRTHQALWSWLRTAVVSIILLAVFGGLFSSADALFGAWTARLLPDLSGLGPRVLVWVLVTGLVCCATFVAVGPPSVNNVALRPWRPADRTYEWAIPVGLVIATFVMFVAAQTAAMFGGHDYVQRTTGLTYAENVHRGFGQLLVVTALTLLVVWVVSRKVQEGRAIRIAVMALCLLALVVVASALHRMHVYQQAYGFTVIRVLVDACELWLGVIIVFVIAARLRSAWQTWLPRAAAISGALFIAGLGVANTDAWIADRNIDRFEATGKVDQNYLRFGLSADAAPTIARRLPRTISECAILLSADHDDWLGWNLGRSRANALGIAPLFGPQYSDQCGERANAHP